MFVQQIIQAKTKKSPMLDGKPQINLPQKITEKYTKRFHVYICQTTSQYDIPVDKP